MAKRTLIALLFACTAACDSSPEIPFFGFDGGNLDVARSDVQADTGPDADADADAPDVATDVARADVALADVRTDVARDTGEPTPASLSVATFNLERFFDTTCDSSSCGNGAFESQPSEAQFDYRAGQIAAAIEAMEVDVVLLQEVETQDSLDALVEKLAWENAVYLLGETGYSGSLDTAIIARDGELLDTADHLDRPLVRPDGTRTSFTRALLEIHVSIQGHRFIFLNGHFKSQRDDDAGRRIAEAGAAGDIADALRIIYPDAVIVLGGDLNDEPGSTALNALTDDGGFDRVAERLGDADGTYQYGDTDSAIDHLFLVGAPGSVVDGSVRIFRDASGGYGGSDHGALRATIGVE